MLQQTQLTAADHGIGLLMLQQHPHHTGLGQEGPELRQDAAVARVPEHGAVKAGAVVVVGEADPLLQLRLTPGRGVDRQIAPLGVARQADGSRMDPGEGLQIAQGLLLGRDLGLEAHVEILLPARQGQVGAPVGDDRPALRQQPGDCRELALTGRQLAAVKYQPQLPESGRPGTFGDQVRIPLYPDPPVPVRQGQEGLRRHLQRHRVQKIFGHQPGKVDVAQLRQDQRVHRIQRHRVKIQVPPPEKIVK